MYHVSLLIGVTFQQMIKLEAHLIVDAFENVLLIPTDSENVVYYSLLWVLYLLYLHNVLWEKQKSSISQLKSINVCFEVCWLRSIKFCNKYFFIKSVWKTLIRNHTTGSSWPSRILWRVCHSTYRFALEIYIVDCYFLGTASANGIFFTFESIGTNLINITLKDQLFQQSTWNVLCS